MSAPTTALRDHGPREVPREVPAPEAPAAAPARSGFRQRRSTKVFAGLTALAAVGGLAAAFVPPLYYQYFPLPGYPVRYANWVALGWLAAGLFIVAVLPKRALDHVEDLFTELPAGTVPTK